VTTVVPLKEAFESLTTFKPQEARKRDAEADSVISFAQRVRDWPTLERAVDQKIADQQEFVEWWNDKVTGNRHNINPSENADRGFLSVAEAEARSGITQQTVSKWRDRLQDVEVYRERLFGPSYRAALGLADARPVNNNSDNEWFTPSEYIELARTVLGEIDLDPASNAKAQEVVRAKRYFTREDSGLNKEWTGRVWLNPPYAQPLISQFVGKLVDERRVGRVDEAILLTNYCGETAWFQQAGRICDALCVPDRRIRFVNPKGVLAAPTQGQYFTYFGGDAGRFVDVFKSIGLIFTPVG
jgi:hypothetical protein